MVIHGAGRQVLWWIIVLIDLQWWIVGIPAHGVLSRDGYPFRWELTAVVDSTVSQ